MREGSDARRKKEKKKKEMAIEGRRELSGERETSTRIKTTCFRWKLGPEIKKSRSLGGNSNTKWSRYQLSKIT